MSLCRFLGRKNICHHFPVIYSLNSIISRQKSDDGGNISAPRNIFDYYCESFFIASQSSTKLRDNFSFNKYDAIVKNDQLQDLFSKLSNEEILLEIDHMIRDRRPKEAVMLLKLCAENQIDLPQNFLLYILKLFSSLGEKEGLKLAIDKFKTIDRESFEKENQFKHYVAQSSWMQGNFRQSIKKFMELYQINNCFRPVEKLVLHSIISDCISNRGEAPLNIIKEFVEDISNNHGDYLPMVMLWQNLFESEWFADQQLSRKLLNDNQNLIDSLHWMIPIWSFRLLKANKTDVVFRLCQVLLEYNRLDCYSSVLHYLFEYYYIRGNLKKCTTIVKNSVDLNIPLKESQQRRFLILLTTGKPDFRDLTETSCKLKIDLKF